LITRIESARLLCANKTYFGGGTIATLRVDRLEHSLRAQSSLVDANKPWLALEDGTPNFCGISELGERCVGKVALIYSHEYTGIGFNTLYTELGGMSAIESRAVQCATSVRLALRELVHANNGTHVATIYESGVEAHRGPVVAFNLWRSNGQPIGFVEVGTLASLVGIQLRCGCFCKYVCVCIHICSVTFCKRLALELVSCI
jgi:selenocysteine lyase/cysteine desulfurase